MTVFGGPDLDWGSQRILLWGRGDVGRGPQMVVGVNKMERRGKYVFGNELSRCRDWDRRSWELCRTQEQARVAGRGGHWEGRRGHPSPGWTPGLTQVRKWQLSPHFRLMEEHLEVILFLLILDFLLL